MKSLSYFTKCFRKQNSSSLFLVLFLVILVTTGLNVMWSDNVIRNDLIQKAWTKKIEPSQAELSPTTIHLTSTVSTSISSNKINLTATSSTNLSKRNLTTTTVPSSTLSDAKELTIFDSCSLYEHDAFEENYVKSFFDPTFNHTGGCTPEVRYTRLVKGYVELTEEGRKKKLNCKGRCVHYVQERRIGYGQFFAIDPRTEFECDIIETVCNKGAYTDAHVQIYANSFPNKPIKRPSHKQYDIYVLIMDSHSHTQSLRNFPTTLRYLKKNMSTVTFPYLNRVGMNSYPNGIALFAGFLYEKLVRDHFDLPSVEPDFSSDKACEINFTDISLFSNATKAGYKTMIGDDQSPSAAGYPNCVGFDKNPANHIFSPLPILLNINKHGKYSKTKIPSKCYMPYMDIMNYWKEFMYAYDEPKFSVMWFTDLAHDDQSGSLAFDGELRKFLETHHEKLDKSFFFFMGDHGFRLSQAVLRTPLGAYEENNPMLTISVPKDLRKNKKLMRTLQKNAQSLQTAFDVRATLLDILGPMAVANYQDFREHKFPKERGSSFLRAQPQPRNCKTLPIPFQYCLCVYRIDAISTTDSFANELGNFVIDTINQRLKETNVSHICGKWTFGKVHELRRYYDTGNSDIYSITLSPKGPYHRAIFKTMIIEREGKRLIQSILRVDWYRSRGTCVFTNSHLCDCIHQKNFIEKIIGIWPF